MGYIIIPPELGKEVYLKGEELHFKVLLLGEAVQYAHPLADAIQGIGKLGLGASRYPFELKKIRHSLDQRVIWENGFFYEVSVRSSNYSKNKSSQFV